MLFRRSFHDGIRDGSIDRTFRAWTRPQVKVGGRYRLFSGGALEVRSVDRVVVAEVTDAQARKAGFASREELLAELRRGRSRARPTDTVFRVVFRSVEDTRSGPATDAELDAGELDGLCDRLDRMDARSQRGAWTRATLALIRDHPRRRAGDLAPLLGRELRDFKADVRKLKKLGLTESFEVGYGLTPRGRRVLRRGGRPRS